MGSRIPTPRADARRHRVRVQTRGRSYWFGSPHDIESWRRAHAFVDRLAGGQDAEEAHAAALSAPVEDLPLVRPPQPARPPESDLTLRRGGPADWAELWLAFLRYAHRAYRKRGRPTRHYRKFLRLSELFAADEQRAVTPVDEFGPRLLQDFRVELSKLRRPDGTSALARTTLNEYIACIVQVVRWGESQELVRPGMADWLRTVPAVRKGRPAAADAPVLRETACRAPPSIEIIERTCAHATPAVAAMIRLQRRTGMRCEEVIGMRAADLSPTEHPLVMVYRVAPDYHKLEHIEGASRLVLLGPRCRRLAYPWLRLAQKHGERFLFSPRLSERVRAQRLAAARVTPKYGRLRDRGYLCDTRLWDRPALTEAYTTDGYRRAVKKACEHAGLPRDQWWSPGLLRHSGASAIAKAMSIEVAREVLGHADIATTQRYVHNQLGDLVEAAAQVL